MRPAMSQLNLSARAYHRTRSVKLARTVADLAGCEDTQSVHLVEALHAAQSSQAEDGLDNTQSGFMGENHKPGLHFVCHDYSQSMISAVLRSKR